MAAWATRSPWSIPSSFHYTIFLQDIREEKGRQALRKIERKSPKSNGENQKQRKKAIRHNDSILEVVQDSDKDPNTSANETVKKTSPKTLQRKQKRVKSVQFTKSPVQHSQTTRKTSKQRKTSNQSKPQKASPQNSKRPLPPILKPVTPVKPKNDKYSSWAESLESLNLNLEEVSHIRTQLTSAELEEKNFDNEFHSDLQNGKICFICMTVRFGIISWAYNCRICKKYVSCQFHKNSS